MTAGDIITVRGSLYARKAAAFDGTDDYILADAHAVARVAANDTVGTYSAWFYKDGVGTEQAILSTGDNDSASEYMMIFVGTGDTIRVKMQHASATQFQVDSAVTVKNRTWYHVAVVQDGSLPIIYINGVAVPANTTVRTDLTFWYDELTGCDKFAIGCLVSNNTFTYDWKGMISDVKYWNKALTASEVKQDFDGQSLADDGTYLQLHLLKGDYGVTDKGLGADNGTLTGHAYLCGWGSEWSREIELNAVVADSLTTVFNGNSATTAIVKAA